MNEVMGTIILSICAAVLLTALVGAGCWAYPTYRVWEQGKSGEAKLREAEHSRQIRIEEAKAKLESATHEADAEVARAHGVAEANLIIGDSLKNNQQYLRYLWILGLQDGTSEIIYIPTEANIPIMEAGRVPLSQPTPVPVNP